MKKKEKKEKERETVGKGTAQTNANTYAMMDQKLPEISDPLL